LPSERRISVVALAFGAVAKAAPMIGANGSGDAGECGWTGGTGESRSYGVSR
jgi:hypothetical protein